jgi:hypothetical protein
MLSSKINIPIVIVIGNGLIGNTQNGALLKQNSMGRERMLSYARV